MSHTLDGEDQILTSAQDKKNVSVKNIVCFHQLKLYGVYVARGY